MSPEQASGDRVDGRSDLYSLGIVGYFALTGSVPFTGSTQAVLAQQITKDAPPVSSMARGLPRQLADAIDRCLLKDSSRRFASGAGLADALAPTTASSGDIPAPLRVFIEQRRNVGLVVIPIMSGVWGGLVMATEAARPPLVFMGGLLVGIGIVVPATILIHRLRNLARIGYGPADIAGAIRRSWERKREEFLYDYGPTEMRRERVARKASLGLIGVGIAAGALSIAFDQQMLPSAIQAAVGRFHPGLPPLTAFGFWGILLARIAWRWKQLRENTEPRMSRFWNGPIGRFLGRVAAWKLRGKAVATERATEVAIAMLAEDMFVALPKEIRRQLGDVPSVLTALRQRATSAREQLASLDDSIAMAERAPAREAAKATQNVLVADLRSARHQVDGRLSEIVTALETIRLDLLRLQAGVGSVEHITLDLAAAEEVGREADRLVAGRREVEDALRRRGD